jgi:hypothetical protein
MAAFAEARRAATAVREVIPFWARVAYDGTVKRRE